MPKATGIGAGTAHSAFGTVAGGTGEALARRPIRAPTLESSPKLLLLAIRDEEAGAATLRPLPHTVQGSILDSPPWPRSGHAQDMRKIKVEDKGSSSTAPEQQDPSQRRSWLHRFFFGPG
jgi:hypothetical protein